MSRKAKPAPRSWLPMVTLRGNYYIPGGFRVTAKPGTQAAKLRLDYGQRQELIACQVPTQATYSRARRYAERELLPAQCFEAQDGGEA